ncbi:hypothetical protein J4Q44_G00305870 [Coregonus suidteri]|uniref:Uncharacterized protein n=1 Tax=Coregonus suidteri TaxID=861788 RepID=A0AAN8QRF1_9TELE
MQCLRPLRHKSPCGARCLRTWASPPPPPSPPSPPSCHWTKDPRRTVGMGEAAEGGGIRGVVVILVLHDFPAATVAGLELVPQLCHQVVDIPHHGGAQAEQTEQED